MSTTLTYTKQTSTFSAFQGEKLKLVLSLSFTTDGKAELSKKVYIGEEEDTTNLVELPDIDITEFDQKLTDNDWMLDY